MFAKGYLPTTLLTLRKLQEILAEVKKSLQYTNPDYTLVLDRLHLYYNMQLVTFGIDKDMNLVIQYPVFIQPYTQKPLILYQLETVPVLILDTNTEAQSYTHLKVKKPYIALNSETYISLTNQELRSCKKIGNAFYCEELFIAKCKSSYSHESAIYVNFTTDIIRNNCNFDFYCNKTDVTPTVLDGGDEIILANWPNDKHIICNINNDIPVKIPSHSYVLVNRSNLCNCGIEADNHHLLESIASCDEKFTKLTLYFTINLAFTNYLDMLPNLTEPLTLIRDRTHHEEPLPIHLNIPHYDDSLTNRPRKLKEFLDNYIHSKDDKEIFDLQKRHTTHTFSPYKNIFLNQIVNIFTFTSSIISIITIMLVTYLFCKHKHSRTIVANLILYKTKEVEAKLTTETNNPECSTLAYIGMALTILSMAIVIFLHYRKSKFCRGYRFSNIVKIVLFISDEQNYIPMKLCKTSGSFHLFKIKGMLKPEDIKLNKNYLWDTLEINWNGIKLSFNGNEIDLPKIITIKIRDKIRVRRMINKETQNFHIMIKQGITWYNLETEIETV